MLPGVRAVLIVLFQFDINNEYNNDNIYAIIQLGAFRHWCHIQPSFGLNEVLGINNFGATSVYCIHGMHPEVFLQKQLTV